jgi:hypothetical protein
MKNLALRGLGILVTGALVGSMGLATSAQAAPVPVPAGVDPSPVALGAAYLAAQPGTDNIIVSYYGGFGSPSVGLTIDAATALDAVGGYNGKVNGMTTAIAANAETYSRPNDTYTVVAVNAASKIAAFAASMGANPRSFGGVDLITRIENRVDADGRISDEYVTSNPDSGDFASPLGEAYAAQALKAGASTKAALVLDDLGKQQCTGTGKGFFRASFAAQVCNNDMTAVASVDTTAIAVLALQAQKADPVVAPMLAKAVEWLVAQQAANGSFNNGNANSTGLATWALGLSARPNVAAKGAGWLRGHQLANAGSCAPYATTNNGAIVLDDLGLANANAAAGPLSNDDNSVATRATAQALPGLIYADGGAAAGDTKLTVPTGYVRAGSAQALTIAGAPGNTVCVTNGATSTRVVLGAGGAGSVPVVMPNATVNTTLTTVDAGGETDSATFRALGATNVDLKVRGGARLVVGRQAVIKVKGLAAGEAVKLKFRGVKVASGVANAAGKITLRFKATKVVRGNIKATGAFSDRQGTTRLVVIPRRR